MSVCIALIRYNGLVTYTENGVKMTKDISARVEHTKVSFQAIGAKVNSSHITVGRYDAVMELEFPSSQMSSRLDDVIEDSSARIEILQALSKKDLERVLAVPV
jgi:uncharacterized protein with GYD domain